MEVNMSFSSFLEGLVLGHLPVTLNEALEQAEGDDHPWYELICIHFFNPTKQQWWDGLDAGEQANWLLGQLWNCADIVPEYICALTGVPGGCTYSRLARKLKAELSGREGDFSASGRVSPGGWSEA
jgi:hypothetical protein